MKNYLLPSLKLSAVFIVLCSVVYPLVIAAVGTLAPGRGRGETVTINGKLVGYANVGQRFTENRYFWGRPSAVNYNAAGSGGSNKGPNDSAYLAQVSERIHQFMLQNPTVKKELIPADLVTASASGLDPDLSPAAAYIQVERVAQARGIAPEKIKELVTRKIQQPLLGLFGPAKVNVLLLNIALDQNK